MTLTISTKRVIQVLALMVLCITLANLFAQSYKLGFITGPGSSLDFKGDEPLGLFDVGAEGNIPAWYSSSTILLCSVLLAIIATAKKRIGDRYALHWSALSLIFLYLSVDEAAELHEKVGRVMKLLLEFQPGGFLRYAWIIPYAVLLLFFVLAMFNFLVGLPSKTRWLFVIAGFIYCGGALVLEMVEAQYVDLYGESGIVYSALVGGEELLEMIGIIVFIYALMSYISTYLKPIHVYIDGKRDRTHTLGLRGAQGEQGTQAGTAIADAVSASDESDTPVGR